MTSFKLNQHIDVALRAEILSHHRAKERQLPDVMFLAEIFDLLGGQESIDIHAMIIACGKNKRTSSLESASTRRLATNLDPGYDGVTVYTN